MKDRFDWSDAAEINKRLREDRKILERIDAFGKGLTRGEKVLLESFLRWTEGVGGKPLTDAQRKAAEDIDERRVGV